MRPFRESPGGRRDLSPYSVISLPVGKSRLRTPATPPARRETRSMRRSLGRALSTLGWLVSADSENVSATAGAAGTQVQMAALFRHVIQLGHWRPKWPQWETLGPKSKVT